MTLRIFAALIALLLFASPALGQVIVGGQAYGEVTAIDVTDATTDQSSGLITRPVSARGLLVTINVTAGTSLLNDLVLRAYSPGLDEYHDYAAECPSANGITGAGVTQCAYYSQTAAGENYTPAFFSVAIPSFFDLKMVVGNANAATYTVYYEWIWQ